MPSLLECKRTPRRSPKHLLQGQKNHPRHHIAGLTQKPLQFHKIYLKKKNIYIYNIHIIQFFSTAAHFAFPKNLKASPVARKHVARPRWCDCSARILILWCPRFVIYSRTLTPNFPLRLLSAIIRMTRNFWNHHEKQHMSITKFFAFSHIKIEVSFLKCDLDMNQNMNVNVHLQT